MALKLISYPFLRGVRSIRPRPRPMIRTLPIFVIVRGREVMEGHNARWNIYLPPSVGLMAAAVAPAAAEATAAAAAALTAKLMGTVSVQQSNKNRPKPILSTSICLYICKNVCMYIV